MAYSFSRLRQSRATKSFPALLCSITVVAVSQVAWALPRTIALASKAPLADPNEPNVQTQGVAQPTATPRDPGARADTRRHQDLTPRSYLLAFGGAVATGPAGLTGGFGTIEEGFVRATVLPPLGLGIGLSFFDLSVSNTDNYHPLEAQALELNASWHPLKSCFDPYLQFGELRLINVSQDPGLSPPAIWNTEGRLGVNLAVPYFAMGVQVRSGLGRFGWLMVGFQLEGRI